ncbi:MAG: hypothetical protein J1F02_12080 [Lachnospiraceae bacterium]|nr:hypothetical protein [Lachnospiraceae bacterium]
MICPKCGSNHVLTEEISETVTKEKVKGYGCIKGCLGFLIFSVPGILCGLCGAGKGKSKSKTKTKVVHICQDCGRQF